MGGSCCCGLVQFELLAPPTMMGTCHCSRCRKAGASAIVFVKRADIKWVSGRDQIAQYKPEEPYKYTRCFCKNCGTSLGEILSEDESFPIAANTLDADPGIRNQFHEFVAEKPDWYAICDDAKQFDGHPTRSE